MNAFTCANINDATTQLQGCPPSPWLKLTNGVSDVELLTKVTYKVRTDYHYRLISSGRYGCLPTCTDSRLELFSREQLGKARAALTKGRNISRWSDKKVGSTWRGLPRSLPLLRLKFFVRRNKVLDPSIFGEFLVHPFIHSPIL